MFKTAEQGLRVCSLDRDFMTGTIETTKVEALWHVAIGYV